MKKAWIGDFMGNEIGSRSMMVDVGKEVSKTNSLASK